MGNRLLNTVIIDDEVAAILELIDMLNIDTSINIVGTATNLDEGIELIKMTQPNIVFLDIDMPFKSGLEIFEEFEEPDFKIIFCTSKNKFPCKNLVPYPCEFLIKPIDIHKLKESLQNVTKALWAERHLSGSSNTIFTKDTT